MAKKKIEVGSVVLFYPQTSDAVARSNKNEGPVAAIITRVWPGTEGLVNLKIFPDCGAVQDRGSVYPKSEAHKDYCYE